MLVQRSDSGETHARRHATWGMSVETVEMLALCATIFDYASMYMSLVAEISGDAQEREIIAFALAEGMSERALERLDGDLMAFMALMHDSTAMVNEMSGEELVEGVSFCE